MGSDGECEAACRADRAAARSTGVGSAAGPRPAAGPPAARREHLLRTAYSERDMRAAGLASEAVGRANRSGAQLPDMASCDNDEPSTTLVNLPHCLSSAEGGQGFCYRAASVGQLPSVLYGSKPATPGLVAGTQGGRHARGSSDPLAATHSGAFQQGASAEACVFNGGQSAAAKQVALANAMETVATFADQPVTTAILTKAVPAASPLSHRRNSSSSSSVGGSSRNGSSSSAADLPVAAAASPTTIDGLPQSTGSAALRAAPEATHGHDRGRWHRLIPSYKQRADEFKRLFKDLADDERLIVDYSCALQKDILVHGRLYVSQNWICFYANFFRWESMILIPMHEIIAITKCRTAKVIPNAIQITTAKERVLFSSFVARDQAYLVLFRAWMCALSNHPIAGSDLWSLVRWLYHSPSEATAAAAAAADALSLEAHKEALSRDHSISDSLPVGDTSELTAVKAPAGRRSRNVMRDLSIDDAGQDTVLLDSEDSASSGGSCSASLSSSDAEPPSEGEEVIPGAEQAVTCPTLQHEHCGVPVVDALLDIPAQELFDILFTGSPFFMDFLSKRGTTDVVQSAWPEASDAEGRKQRTITYTLTLNAAFGPKTSPAKEVQTILAETMPGAFYAVDCQCLNAPTLPYGENFFVLNKYCIMCVSSVKCRLLVHSDIVYTKSVFSLVKGIIQRNVAAGVKDYFHQLREMLLVECSVRRQHGNTDKAPSGKVTRRSLATPRQSSSRVRQQPDAGEAQRQPSAAAAEEEAEPIKLDSRHATRSAGEGRPPLMVSPGKPGRSHHRRLLLNATLCLLLAANVLMFYHTWHLDDAGWGPAVKTGNAEHAQDEIIRILLQQHEQLHESEAEHWRQLVESSSLIVSQLQKDIQELRRLIDARTELSPVVS